MDWGLKYKTYIKHNTVILLWVNIWKKLLDTGLGNDFFLWSDTKNSSSNKNRNQQEGLCQIKNIAKETINKIKMHCLEWKKILANLILDKWLISKINKEPIQPIQIANRYVKSIFHSRQIWKQSKSLATDEWIKRCDIYIQMQWNIISS